MSKIGLYVKGFVMKFGYCLAFSTIFAGMPGVHDFTFEFGYKINWNRKLVNSHKLFVIPR